MSKPAGMLSACCIRRRFFSSGRASEHNSEGCGQTSSSWRLMASIEAADVTRLDYIAGATLLKFELQGRPKGAERSSDESQSRSICADS
jgi:hypothetical protein